MTRQAERRLRVIRTLLLWQLAVALGAGLVGLAVAGVAGGASALAGGLICWLPSCWFAFRAFRHRGARAARQIVRSFYAGEAGKMVLTVLLFAAVFINVKSVDAPALFIGYAAVQLVFWVVPLVAARADARDARGPAGTAPPGTLARTMDARTTAAPAETVQTTDRTDVRTDQKG